MNAFLRYTVLRIMVFLGCLILLWLLGLRNPGDRLTLLVGALVLSMVVSYFALRRFREDYSAQVASTIERRTAARQARPVERGGVDEEAEDAELEEHESHRAAPTTTAGAEPGSDAAVPSEERDVPAGRRSADDPDDFR